MRSTSSTSGHSLVSGAHPSSHLSSSQRGLVGTTIRATLARATYITGSFDAVPVATSGAFGLALLVVLIGDVSLLWLFIHQAGQAVGYCPR